MGNGYRVPASDPWDKLLRELERLAQRVTKLERPTGTQVAEALKTLTDLVNGLLEQNEVNVSGGVTAGGAGVFGGNVSTSGYFYTPAGYSFDITYTRRAAWLGNDGLLGWASSSIDGKELVEDEELPDPLAILEIADVYYVRKAEIEKRAADPAYHVQLEYGNIAEWVHDLGLWQAVIYEDGKPVGIHDSVLAKFAIRAARYIWGQHLALEQRVANLERQG